MLKLLITAAALTTSVSAYAGDLRCSGKTDATYPIIANVTGEEPGANGVTKQLELEVKKNGGYLYRSGKKDAKPASVKGQFALFNLEAYTAYKASLAIPVSGTGQGEVRLTEAKSNNVVAVIPLQCSKTTGLSNRDKNNLCIKAAEAAVEKLIHEEDKDASITDEPAILDKDGNNVEIWEAFTGIYAFEYSVNEECLDGVQVKTRLTKDAKGQPKCEVISTDSLGQRDCG